jgi:hypothetical protein
MLSPTQTSESSAPSDAGLQHTLVVNLREADSRYEKTTRRAVSLDDDEKDNWDSGEPDSGDDAESDSYSDTPDSPDPVGLSADQTQDTDLMSEEDQPHTPDDRNAMENATPRRSTICVATIHEYSPEYSLFVDRLQAIVQCDGKDHPRIDMVHIRCSMRLPDETIYEVLKGLRPRHFNLESSRMEECRLESLEQLAWPLESLIICGASADFDEEPSDVVRLIPSLTLDGCINLFFAPATNAAVRHLTIIRNNTVDMFIDLVEKFGVANNLQTLKINFDNDFNRYTPADFTKTLKQCTSLLSLDLAPEISDEDKYGNRRSYLSDLPQYFPDSVESLRFSGPVAMADDFSTWLQYATDPSWMPNLQTLAFRLRGGKKSSRTTLAIESHVQRFLDTMLASHPGLQIVN